MTVLRIENCSFQNLEVYCNKQQLTNEGQRTRFQTEICRQSVVSNVVNKRLSQPQLVGYETNAVPSWFEPTVTYGNTIL